MRKRWWLLLAALLLLGALLLAGSALLLRQLPGLQGLQGSIWTGLRAEQLGGEAGGLRWRLEGLELAPVRWQGGHLQTALRLRSLQIVLPPGDGSPPPTADQLLERLRTPLGLRIAPLQIDRLELNGQRIELLHVQAVALGRDSAAIEGLSLREPRSGVQLKADARLDGDGSLSLRLQAVRERLSLRAEGRGRLDALPLQLRLQEAEVEQLQAELLLAPLAAEPLQILRSLDARFAALNPRSLHAQAPVGAWSGRLQLGPGEQQPLRLQLAASNASAARLDQGGWPLRQLRVDLQLDPARWQALALQQFELDLGGAGRDAGRLQLLPQQGIPQTGQPLDSSLRLLAVQLRELDARWPVARLDGELGLRQARLDLDAPLDWRLRLQAALPKPVATWLMDGSGSLQGRRLQLAALQLRQGEAKAQLKGDAELLAAGWRSQGELQIDGLSLPLPPWPAPSRLHAQAGWQLREDGQGRQLGQLRLLLQDGNRIAGLPLQGEIGWQGEAAAQQWSAALQGADGLKLGAQGRLETALRARAGLPAAIAWLPQQADWSIPQLAALQPLWQPWLKQLGGRAEGRWRSTGGSRWPQQAELLLSELRLQTAADQPPLRLAHLQASLGEQAGELKLQGLSLGDWLLESLAAQGGREQAWRLDAQALQAGTRRWRLQGSSAAPQIDDGSWRWPALQLQLIRNGEAAPLLRLSEATLLASANDGLRLQGGSLVAAGEPLSLQQASWRRDGPWALALQGRPRFAGWLRQLDPSQQAWSGDAAADLKLVADGDGSARPRVDLQLSGLQGDLRLNNRPLGLQTLALQLRQQASGQASLLLGLKSTLLGELQSQLTQTEAGALAGQLRAQLPQLAALRPWLPGGLQIEGGASLDALVGGSLQDPRLRGSLALQLQRLLHPGSGFATQQGELLAEFSEDRLLLKTLRLQGQEIAGTDAGNNSGGQLSGSGELRWGGDAPTAELQLKAERFRALNRFDRRLVASGELSLAMQARKLQLRGKLTADEGVYEIGRPDAPVLDEDVVLAERDEGQTQKTAKTSRWQREVDLQLDLGQRLRVQGRGFASRLTGQLRLQEQGGQGLRATGRIETQGGRYKAYGQTLDLESGEIRFSGSLDNPRLDLLAIKPDIEHRVGVQVTGNAQSPRVRLYAEPELSDNDKLAWLLLGRDPAEISGRDTAILQRAALALLSGEGSNPAGELMDRLGLTEFSIGQGEDAATVLRLGAQLSRRWSVGYERSLNAATGSWQLVYRLGQRFRLRAQSGLDSAVDLLWLWRFD